MPISGRSTSGGDGGRQPWLSSGANPRCGFRQQVEKPTSHSNVSGRRRPCLEASLRRGNRQSRTAHGGRRSVLVEPRLSAYTRAIEGGGIMHSLYGAIRSTFRSRRSSSSSACSPAGRSFAGAAATGTVRDGFSCGVGRVRTHDKHRTIGDDALQAILRRGGTPAAAAVGECSRVQRVARIAHDVCDSALS